MLKVIDKKELEQFLKELSREYRIIAPVLRQCGKKEKVEYQEIDDFSEVYLDRQPDCSPKKYFLPQNEKLGDEAKGEPLYVGGDKKRLLFGVRSCDLKALSVVKEVFIDDNYEDTYFNKRLENTVVFGLGCSSRQDNCFCDSLNIDPLDSKDVPVYMYDDGEKLWFKVQDESFEKVLKGASEGDSNELEKKQKEWRKSFAESAIEIDTPIPMPEMEAFNAPFWKEVASNCLGCGVCTFYCPTCYCFGFFWEKGSDEIDKWRTWDSCMYPLFTKHSSGHNPRTVQEQRTRQRIMHKFSYHPNNFNNVPACSGCGRCISQCPVNIDLRVVLKTAEKYLQNTKDTKGVKSSG